MSVAKGADVVKAFPKLGWVDSSSSAADTVAAPLLSVAGVVCLPAFIEDPTTPASRAILGLAEVTVVPSLAFVNKCADACSSLGILTVPLYHYTDWVHKLGPALGRTPSPSPFSIGAGDLVEANAFRVVATSAPAPAPAPLPAPAPAPSAAPARASRSS